MSASEKQRERDLTEALGATSNLPNALKVLMNEYLASLDSQYTYMGGGDHQWVVQGEFILFAKWFEERKAAWIEEPTDNLSLSYELLGVIVDVEEGRGFDEVCLRTIKRVQYALGASK